MDGEELLVIKRIEKKPMLHQFVLNSLKSQLTQMQDLLEDVEDEGNIPVLFTIKKKVYTDKIKTIEDNLNMIRLSTLAYKSI